MIAAAARETPSALQTFRRLPSEAKITSSGNCTPITPVELTRTSLAGQFHSAAAASITFAARLRPSAPVAAFAQPELITMPRTLPLDLSRFSLETVIGAAHTRFCVNTAAPAAPRGQ